MLSILKDAIYIQLRLYAKQCLRIDEATQREEIRLNESRIVWMCFLA